MAVEKDYPDDVAGLFQRLGRPGRTPAYHDFSPAARDVAPPPAPAAREFPRPVAVKPVTVPAPTPVPAAPESAPAAAAPTAPTAPVPVTPPPVAPAPVAMASVARLPVEPAPAAVPAPAPTPLQQLFLRLLAAPLQRDERSPLERLTQRP